MKKLYTVEVKYTGVVLAESKEDAESFLLEVRDTCNASVSAETMTILPWPWDYDEYVIHGGIDDITVKQAIEMTKEDA